MLGCARSRSDHCGAAGAVGASGASPSVGAGMPAGTRGVRKAGQNTRGSELAASSIERLLATPYDHPDLDLGAHNDPANPYDGKYFVSWAVDTGQPIVNCKRITVTVRWPSAASLTNVRLIGVRPECD